MNQLKNQTIGQLVAEDYRTAQVFRSFNLDFCCGGNKTVKEACNDSGVDYQEVKQALRQLDEKQNGAKDNYNEWSLDFLIDYIVNNHHKFSRNKLPEIGAYTKKVASVHGENHPELKQIYHEFTMLHGEMINHLDKEEEILFPYVKQLVEAKQQGRKPDRPDFGEAADPIAMMEQEHDDAGAAMRKIRELSDDFTPPEDACTTYQLLFENLEAFEKDLHKHVHLENNILFPKALQLEKSLYQN
ncbi:iron-sulfur cluster repair di-iron protein [Aliifodinibius sp. S!AR15-10]|uniref:iron-sulfur cluster repair di-iron protein n=1 Tax=Aliifodinibius sp. S!AR15-10 TaxID=2950437 RepID=UPI0028669C1F|nr:iron-sulfur cluster repair di-iron protein [Aliifodinibius sp. S!AR15-10]MDR8390684.1 iron-sulfur cluster repair di-iron protein [Aliifodinibius sp. S!AR15-10]